MQSVLSPSSKRNPPVRPAGLNVDGSCLRSWFALSMTVCTGTVCSFDARPE
ncbi:hypothetical protein ACFPN7_29610 [Amycolatopsis halotolerans]|uniref:hypothetical protein n=1 Tax=Amycolatopsis halotolerans TaxID=330083 RepID=UPI003620EDBE